MTLNSRPTRTWRNWILALGVLCACLWTAAPVHAEGKLYKVRPGDTLAAIASSHGTTVSAIMRLNKITDRRPHSARTAARTAAGSSACRLRLGKFCGRRRHE